MAFLATPEQLASHMQRDLDRASAELALGVASRSVRNACHWNIEQVVDATVTVRGGDVRVVFLPVKHVTAATVTAGGDTLVVDVDYTLHAEAAWIELDLPRDQVTVTYTAGWPSDQIPEDVAGVVLDIAASRYGNPRKLRSWQLGEKSETYAGASGDPVKVDTDTRLDPYRVGPAF